MKSAKERQKLCEIKHETKTTKRSQPPLHHSVFDSGKTIQLPKLNCQIQALARRIFQFLTDFCSWPISVPDSFLFLADSCSLQTLIPGRLMFLEYSCSWLTQISGKLIFLAELQSYSRLLFLADSRSWQAHVPETERVLSWQIPVHCKLLFLADLCSWRKHNPGKFMFLEDLNSWQNHNCIADSCSSPIHVPGRLIANSDSRPRLMFLKEFCPSSFLFLTDSCSYTVANFCSYSRLLFLRSWQI